MGVKILIGKTVKAVGISDDKEILRFDIDGGSPIYFSAAGGCCSHSWVEHILGVDALIGRPIFRVEGPADVDASNVPGGATGELKVYRLTLETVGGRFDIELRNESNGYYGGWFEVGDTPLDQYGHPIDFDGVFHPILEDW